jgi:phosphoribosyl-dephospho-CoA transferase
MADHLRRHDLVQVDPAAWAAVLAARPDLGALAILTGWAQAGRPLVARRRSADDPDGQLALGLPLPPALGKRRIAVTLDPAAIVRVERFPLLRSITHGVPPAWRPATTALLRLAAAVGIEPLVFGSLAWSALTGLDYLGPASDLDLLWPIDWAQGVSGLLDGLRSIAPSAPMRLDGEILDPEGRGVDWRELASGAPEVQGKTLAGVELIPGKSFGLLREPA